MRNTSRGILAGLIFIAISILPLLVPLPESWQSSALRGPSEHLELLVRLYQRCSEYIDGVFRVHGEDWLMGSLHLAVWLTGLAMAFLLTSLIRSKPIASLFLAFWLLIGLLNIYLHAIRSV